MEEFKNFFNRLNSNPGNYLVLFFLVIFSGPSEGQDDYQQFYSRSLNTANTGMYILGTWAIANISTGACGWSKLEGERKYFHQMNLFWNSVNLAIAGFAIYGNLHTDISLLGTGEILQKHRALERILLINAGLDAVYIGTGVLLRHYSVKSEKRHDILKGYGNSIILQGSFLLVFDAVLFSILRTQRMDFLNNIELVAMPGKISVLINF
jgi:hypothetical protein